MIVNHSDKEGGKKTRKLKILPAMDIKSALGNVKSRMEEKRKLAVDDNYQDLVYQGKKVDLRKIPIAREMYLKKKDAVLGKRFRKTLLGYTKGATNQYRGPYSTHVREYSDHYTIHRDFIDPRKNPISHLAKDAPMELAGWLIGGLIALVIIVFLIF